MPVKERQFSFRSLFFSCLRPYASPIFQQTTWSRVEQKRFLALLYDIEVNLNTLHADLVSHRETLETAIGAIALKYMLWRRRHDEDHGILASSAQSRSSIEQLTGYRADPPISGTDEYYQFMEYLIDSHSSKPETREEKDYRARQLGILRDASEKRCRELYEGVLRVGSQMQMVEVQLGDALEMTRSKLVWNRRVRSTNAQMFGEFERKIESLKMGTRAGLRGVMRVRALHLWLVWTPVELVSVSF